MGDEFTEESDFSDDEYDTCYECTGLGDDYYIDDKGELVSRCSECSFFPLNKD